MPNDSQITVPASFIALHLVPGRSRPAASREQIAARHEFCEDLATMLGETASTRRWELGVTEDDVLERVHQGLLAGDSVSADEAGWVVRRLAEMLGWDPPSFLPLPDMGPR